MSRMKLAVCLLALAGSATLFFYSRGSQHRSHARIAASRLLSGKRPASSFSLLITFEPNVGQASSGVQFIGRGKGMSVFLRDEEIAIALPKRAQPSGGGINPLVEIRLVRASASSSRKTRLYSHRRRTRGKTTRSHSRRKRPRLHRGTTLRTGQVPSRFEWRGEGPLAGRSNYFIGGNHKAWRTHVPHYAGADAAEALPGVGMTIYGNGEGVEYDLRLRPGVDSSELRLTFAGADETQLAANGDLVLRAGENELRMKEPTIYEELPEGAALAKESGLQQSDARRHVDGGYVLEADGSVGLATGPHDANASLVIDPSLSVSYSTFLGGAGSEAANSVALDSSGNVYIGGTTSLGAFGEPTMATIGPGIGSSGGSGGNSGTSSNTGTEYFVAKINPNASGASSLVYVTFFGRSISQSAGLIAVNASGNVAVTGTTTSSDFPVTDGSTLTSGSNDATVSEIDPRGSTLLFSTLFGGSGAESQSTRRGKSTLHRTRVRRICRLPQARFNRRSRGDRATDFWRSFSRARAPV